MSTDYNLIALEYKKAKLQPWRAHIEAFTLAQLLGDLSGKSVLDLACGEGFQSRLLKRRGASRVVGVDVSQRMIELAREQEGREPLGIDFLVQDASRLELSERFDLVVAGYLLNYASTGEELLQMCQAIARALKPGGRFVTVNNNPAQPTEAFDCSRPYGFIKVLMGPLAEGTPIHFRIFLDDGPLEIINYHLSTATHEWAFRQAGLHEVHWHPPRLAPQAEEEDGKEYWAPFLRHPPVIFLECRR